MTGLKYRDGHYQHPSASPAPTRGPGFGPADLDSVQDALRESSPPDAHTCDVLALRALLQRCSDIVDGGKWDLLGEVLAPEAVWNASVLGPVPLRLAGVRSIVARHASAPAPLSHQLTNVDVEVTGVDEAFVRSKYLVISDAGNVASGDYLDVVARTPAGWRIVRRETRPRQQ